MRVRHDVSGLLYPQRGLKYFQLDRKDVQDDLDALIKAEADFWQMVTEDRQPGVDGSESTEKTIKLLMKEPISHETDLKKAPSMPDLDEAVEKRQALKDAIKESEAALKEVENTIKDRLREVSADVVYTTDKKVTWKETLSTGLDTEKLKTEFPEVYESCRKTSTYRKLLIGKKPQPKKGKRA